MQKEFSLSKDVKTLSHRVDQMKRKMDTLLENQTIQTQLLQQLLQAPSASQILDANKKGESSLVVFEPVKATSKRDSAPSKGEPHISLPPLPKIQIQRSDLDFSGMSIE